PARATLAGWRRGDVTAPPGAGDRRSSRPRGDGRPYRYRHPPGRLWPVATPVADHLEAVMPTTAPVAALTTLGILLAVLGLFVGGSIELVIVGLLAIFGGGLLQVAGRS